MKQLRAELAALRSERVEEEHHQGEEEEFRPPPPVSPSRVAALREEQGLCPALECIKFALIERPSAMDSLETFPPGFAHQHFEDDEMIRGYRGLEIMHYYASASLFLFTRVTWREKLPGAMNLDAILREYMPDEDVEPSSRWAAASLEHLLDHVAKENCKWQPPGEFVASYTGRDGRTYRVMWGKFTDPQVRRYHQRMRPFVIWFVDGARFLDDTDPKWDVFMLFREPGQEGDALTFCGYVTCYSFFAWSGASAQKGKAVDASLERHASELAPKCVSPKVEAVVSSILTHAYDAVAGTEEPWYERRFRISQFLLLPPFQRSGHGARLFEIIYQWANNHYSPLRDITVEDPSPGFVALRDYCDVAFLAERNLLVANKVGNDQDAIAKALKDRHTCAAQIARVLQIVQWMEAKLLGQEQMDSMRKLIKKRLYKENSADIPDAEVKTIVAQLWEEERGVFDTTLNRVFCLKERGRRE